MQFIGRQEELKTLKGLLNKRSASMVVIRGRRRIGKSRLAQEFALMFSTVYSLSGIAPEEGVTADMQRQEFLRQLQTYQLPIYRSDDWGDMFQGLAQACTKGRVLVILDEITWMGSQDPTFLPKLKNTWDQSFAKNHQLVLIISGSNSMWISKNILNSTGFLGRVSLRIKLGELSIYECNQFWESWPGVISAFEKFKILSVTGGVPRYLEEIRSDLTAEQNICQLCFHQEGLLFNEFDQIFHDLFKGRGTYYQQLLKIISERHLSSKDIAAEMGRVMGGDLSDALQMLEESGFIYRDFTWSLSTHQTSNISRYRIQDNYTRFFLKYIDPIKTRIKALPQGLSNLPVGWRSIMGLQFENLILNNRAVVNRILQLPSEDIINAGSYTQTPRTRRAGCQIDYLIQTRYNVLVVCEIKFQAGPVKFSVIEDMQKKIAVLKIPKGFSMRTVLIHVNGVVDSVVDSGFFSNIIDFSDLLNQPGLAVH